MKNWLAVNDAYLSFYHDEPFRSARSVYVLQADCFGKCDVEGMRIFSQAEIDWRATHAPWNLRRDLKTNATWEAECIVDGVR